MENNRKPEYVILFILLAVWFAAWLLQIGQPVQVDAGEWIKDSEGAEVVTGWEIAPVQLVDGIEIDADIRYVPDMTPEQIAEEEYYDSMELLAICVEAEAGNQSLEGKRLVADVILNRVDDDSGMWADTIPEVIAQSGQFASYADGGMDRVIEPSEETIRAVQMEIAVRGYPEIYYFREGTWSEYGTPWRKVGDHYFSGK